MKAKFPPNVSFQQDIQLLIYEPRGIGNEESVNTVIAFLETEEKRADKPFNRFTDLSKVDAIDLNFHFVFRVSLHRRLVYSQYPPVKSAFYVTSQAAARIVRIHVLMTDHSPPQVAMYEQRASAAEWLGVSEESLD